MKAPELMKDVQGEKKILDLGCGRNKRPGALGIDRVQLPGVDIVHDLNEFPYPFEDNTFDEIYAIHIIEHLDCILSVMEEIHRIAKPGGRVVITTPHYTDAISWQDPTHKWHLNSYSFSYFEPGYHTNHYTRARLRIRKRDVEMGKLWKLTGIQWLVNLDNRFPAARFVRKFWEQYLCFFIRGKQMTFELGVIKQD